MFGYNKKFFYALFVLIGMIVGAGIFGIPYVISKSGIIPGFFYFLILGVAVLLLHLFFSEIVLRTKEKHRLIGYSQKYLGNWGKFFVAITVFIGITGALLAYLIIGGNFLNILFSPWFSLDPFYFTLIFWLILSYFIFRGIKLIAPTEIFTNLFFFFIIFIILCFCFPKINPSSFTLFNLPDIFLPYGVILFALIGWPAIPEVVEILKTPEDKKNLKKILILTTSIIIVFYVLFALTIIGLSGSNTSPEALKGLLPFLGSKIIFFGVLAGLITIADSFLILALSFKNTLVYDFKIPKNLSLLIACGLPLILFLIGFRSFIGTIGFVGTLVGVIEGIVIILIFKKIKELGDRTPEYSLKIPSVLLYFLMLILILGAISQIFYFI